MMRSLVMIGASDRAVQTSRVEQAPPVRLRAVEADPARLAETQHLRDLGVVDARADGTALRVARHPPSRVWLAT